MFVIRTEQIVTACGDRQAKPVFPAAFVCLGQIRSSNR